MASRGVEALDDRELLSLLVEDEALAGVLWEACGGSLVRLAAESEARLRMIGGLGLKRARMLLTAAPGTCPRAISLAFASEMAFWFPLLEAGGV